MSDQIMEKLYKQREATLLKFDNDINKYGAFLLEQQKLSQPMLPKTKGKKLIKASV